VSAVNQVLIKRYSFWSLDPRHLLSALLC